MTRSCSALGCTARDTGRSRERGISFHQFPVDAAQRREWIRAVNRMDPRSRQAWRPGPGAILCSRHFTEDDFERYGMRRKLRRGAVPSRFFPVLEPVGIGWWCKPSIRALKQPVPSPAAEIAAGDHNYSLKEEEAGAGPPPPETPPAVKSCDPAPQPRTVGTILRELAEKQHLPEETLSLLLAQFSDLPCEQQSWRKMAEYSLEMRQFACALQLYNRKAYDCLRKMFPLPNPYSLTNWLSTSEAAAGFSSSIFARLQEKLERGEKAYCYCALMVQDVPLQRQQEWELQGRRRAGFIDLGTGALDADEAPLASEAVLLMAVGISSPWAAPLGYFLVSGASGPLLAQLLRHTISKLNNIGVTVLAVTSGATARGAAAAAALGIRVDPERVQCTFRHPPGSAHSVTYLYDVCHALQLVSNALQDFQKVEWLGDAVQWQHVVELAALREQKASRASGPKSRRPRGKESSYLKVNLATLVFSEGAADALEHLQKLGLASFQNCSGTAKFLRLMSRLCALFDGRGACRRQLKGLLLTGNHTKIGHLSKEIRSCFTALRDSRGRLVLKGKRKLGFLSFLLNTKSLRWLYTNYLCSEDSPSHHLLASAFSLAPLEQFVRALLEACGSRSPTCAAFQAAYHKLLGACSLAPGSAHGSGSGHAGSLGLAPAGSRDLTLGSVRARCAPAGRGPPAARRPCCAAPTGSSALSEALTDLPLRARSLASAVGRVAEQLAEGLGCQDCLASLFQLDESRPGHGAVLYVRKAAGAALPSASLCRIAGASERVLRWHGEGGDGGKATELRRLSLEQKAAHLSGEEAALASRAELEEPSLAELLRGQVSRMGGAVGRQAGARLSRRQELDSAAGRSSTQPQAGARLSRRQELDSAAGSPSWNARGCDFCRAIHRGTGRVLIGVRKQRQRRKAAEEIDALIFQERTDATPCTMGTMGTGVGTGSQVGVKLEAPIALGSLGLGLGDANGVEETLEDGTRGRTAQNELRAVPQLLLSAVVLLRGAPLTVAVMGGGVRGRE
ncbi:DNA transposase THAP9 [Dryobates pubescens]|uniref:DNA transposase THAP9 n=1 Tax=Dryobates pubescens TaxID=118200 RepID=UPI0023B91CE2|nr:DNA transposase THAP9 [Dryobates pubescens]